MPMFTIYIPTYNRASKLDATLDVLLHRCDNRTEIVISDNKSTDNTLEVIIKYKELFDLKNIRFSWHINSLNVGLPLNLAMAFTHVKSKWFLMLGDDDLLDKDSIDHISGLIDLYPNASFFHFDGRIKNNVPIECTNAESFIHGYYAYNHAFWMSTYVFNKDVCSSHFSSFAPFCISSYAPHVVIALASISNVNPCCIAPISIVSMNRAPDNKWAISPVALGLKSILDAPYNISKRGYVELRKDLFKHFPSPALLWYEMYTSEVISQSFQRRRWLLSIFTSWFMPISSKPRVLLAWFAVLFLNECHIGRKILLSRASKKNNVNTNVENNIFDRL